MARCPYEPGMTEDSSNAQGTASDTSPTKAVSSKVPERVPSTCGIDTHGEKSLPEEDSSDVKQAFPSRGTRSRFDEERSQSHYNQPSQLLGKAEDDERADTRKESLEQEACAFEASGDSAGAEEEGSDVETPVRLSMSEIRRLFPDGHPATWRREDRMWFFRLVASRTEVLESEEASSCPTPVPRYEVDEEGYLREDMIPGLEMRPRAPWMVESNGVELEEIAELPVIPPQPSLFSERLLRRIGATPTLSTTTTTEQQAVGPQLDSSPGMMGPLWRMTKRVFMGSARTVNLCHGLKSTLITAACKVGRVVSYLFEPLSSILDALGLPQPVL